MVRNTVSRASTISAEECQLPLTEEDFLAIQRKMDKIDWRLDELYKNWHAEYRDAVSSEDCEEIKSSINHTWRNMNQNIEFCTIYYSDPVLSLHESQLLELPLV